ncbi:TPA: helix-turn-helix domain-containing protein [Providencia stuartii]|uniref:helix-turn-helix domain-containing protein n=1 Tax=Providencia stuartii TaxID=588 RepID=UPI0009BEE3C7|nr:helix-turn-helix domain-containing protein [Providencia stuartii]AVL39861.1 helix-turn-helix domain-containing protein [Providencia stuartii]MBG5902621.1 helix-turn-helix domain-containing protein [Providencia stuartii]MBG5910400.1 helix-turn-helix domain-containing protein [Providencia stuartii]MBG5914194.1 helix-turn-helix domain-containing protein [Providencia stuartii]
MRKSVVSSTIRSTNITRTIQRIENNKVPNIETISALSSVFNVSVSELASTSLAKSIELDNRIAEIRKRVKMKLSY